MKYNIIILLLVSCIVLPTVSVAKECPDSKIWLKKLTLIKPESMKFVKVQDCGDYIHVAMVTEEKDISRFMINIIVKDYGKPLFNASDGESTTESILHIILDDKYNY